MFKRKIISVLDISYTFSFLFMHVSEDSAVFIHSLVTQIPGLLSYSEEEPNGLEKAVANEQKLSFQGRFLTL